MTLYVKRKTVLELVKRYIEYAEEHADNSGYYEAQFEGFQELQDDLFNLNDTEEVQALIRKAYKAGYEQGRNDEYCDSVFGGIEAIKPKAK